MPIDSDVRKYRQGKYSSCHLYVANQHFLSVREARRFSKLAFLAKNGLIHGLGLQPSFKIEHNGVDICKVVFDFCYTYNKRRYFEDVKGFIKPEFERNWKLVQAFYPGYNLCIS